MSQPEATAPAPVVEVEEKTFPQYPAYVHPEYVPLSKDNRMCHCLIRLAAPACPLLDFKLTVPISTQIAALEEHIKRRHGGSVGDISICVGSFSPDKYVPPHQTLEDCGVRENQDVTVYYDFIAISGPLLGN